MERFLIPIKQLFSRWSEKLNSAKSIKPHVEVINLRNPRKMMRIAGGVLLVLGFVLLGVLFYDAQAKLLPNTIIAGESVGSLSQEEVVTRLQQLNLPLPEHTIEIGIEETTIASSSSELDARYDLEKEIGEIFAQQQQNKLTWFRHLLFTPTQPLFYNLHVSYDQEEIAEMVSALKQVFDQPAEPASVSLDISGNPNSIIVVRGKNIQAVLVEETILETTAKLREITTEKLTDESIQKFKIAVITETISERLTDDQVAAAQTRAEAFVDEALLFEKDNTEYTLSDVELIDLIQLPNGYNESAIDEIIAQWTEELNRPPQNAVFEYDPKTLTVTEFVPHHNGWELDQSEMKQQILGGLKELEGTDTANLIDGTITKPLVLTESEPETTLAGTNDMGIVEQIGFGESYYYHSIPNRIHNVSLTAQRIDLTIVPPGKEFSFNQTLGDVSAATGFRSAYVIKDGQTLLGDGGGVCQVSTTLFRALLDSGLNITRRLQHSYRVSYYELDQQPGFDATVYSGNVDLRFINDTDHHVLIRKIGRAHV